MVNVNRYDGEGKPSGSFGLESAVWESRIKTVTVADALVRQLANRRRALPKTKDRSAIRGGGRKPWRQKGTGRARAGSIRSPLWRGGAVAMGPRGETNHTKDMPRKARRAALRALLTSKTREGLVSVMARPALEKPKTARVVEILGNMELAGKKVLFVLPQRDDAFERSVRNLPAAKALIAANLNPHDLMAYERLVVFEDAVARITEVLS
jgi:large subunit ribosomal protein L4